MTVFSRGTDQSLNDRRDIEGVMIQATRSSLEWFLPACSERPVLLTRFHYTETETTKP